MIPKSEHRRTGCLDFDGVLHSYRRGWTGIKPEDPPVEGAQQFCRTLQALGWRLVISSSRAVDPGGTEAIKAWLALHGFPELEVTAEKVPAHFYLDDRGVRFRGNFTEVLAMIVDEHALLPWMNDPTR